MRVFFLVIFSSIHLSVQAQYLTGMGTAWNDSFVEWIVYTYQGEEENDAEGELKMRWQLQENWSEWDYDIEDQIGSIKQKWKDNSNEWEVRGNNKVISTRTSFRDDFTQWRITDNTITLIVETRFGNNGNEWRVRKGEHGFMELYTAWENDPREWIIVDELSEDISLPMKMAVVFLAIYHSSPRQ